jgi:hypothetical protein
MMCIVVLPFLTMFKSVIKFLMLHKNSTIKVPSSMCKVWSLFNKNNVLVVFSVLKRFFKLSSNYSSHFYEQNI